MDMKIKKAVLEHLKSLMDGKMSEDIPVHGMGIVEKTHEVFPIDKTEDIGSSEHDDEGEFPTGKEDILPDLSTLKNYSGKDMEDVEKSPHLEVPLTGDKHPLFTKGEKEEDPELGNHSLVARLKRAQKYSSK